MRFRGPAIATFLQQAEENLALLGAQLEAPGEGGASLRLQARGHASKRRVLSRDTSHSSAAAAGPPPPTTALEWKASNSAEEVPGASDASTCESNAGQAAGPRLLEGWLQRCAGGRSELEEAFEALSESERETREQMDIQARTLLGIDRRVKSFENRLCKTSDEATEATAAAAQLRRQVEEFHISVSRARASSPNRGGVASFEQGAPAAASFSPLAGTGSSSSSSSKSGAAGVEPGGAAAVASLAALAATAAEVCSCGQLFAHDAVYCRTCGLKRAAKGLLAVEIGEFRQLVEAQLQEHSEQLKHIGAVADREVLMEQVQNNATNMVSKLSRSIQQQMDELDCQLQGRFEQRFAALDAEVSRHAQQVTHELIEEYLQGPALEVRIGALFAALQARTCGGGLTGALARQQLRPLEDPTSPIGEFDAFSPTRFNRQASGQDQSDPAVNQLWVRREEFQALEALVLSLREEVAGLRKEANSGCKVAVDSQTAAHAEPAPVAGQRSRSHDHQSSNREERRSVSRATPPVRHSLSLPERPSFVENVAPLAAPAGSVRERVAAFERSPRPKPTAPSAQPQAVAASNVEPVASPRDKCRHEVLHLDKLVEGDTQAQPAGSALASSPISPPVAVAVQDPVALRASYTPKKPRRPGMSPCASPASTSSMRSASLALHVATGAASGEMPTIDVNLSASSDAGFNRVCCESGPSSPKSLCSCPAQDISAADPEVGRAGSGSLGSDIESDTDDPHEAAEAHRILAAGILDSHVSNGPARGDAAEAVEWMAGVVPSLGSGAQAASPSGSNGAGAANSQLWSSVADVLVPTHASVSRQGVDTATEGQSARIVEALQAIVNEQEPVADSAAHSRSIAVSAAGEPRDLWSSLADAPADSLADSATALPAGDASRKARAIVATGTTSMESGAMGASDMWSSVADVVSHAHVGEPAFMAKAGTRAQSSQQAAAASSSDSTPDLWSSVADIVAVHAANRDATAASSVPDLRTFVTGASASVRPRVSEPGTPCEPSLWSSASDTAQDSSASAAENAPLTEVSPGRADWTPRERSLQSDSGTPCGAESHNEVEGEEFSEDEEEGYLDEVDDEDNEVNPLERDGLSTEGSSPATADLRPHRSAVHVEESVRRFEATQACISGSAHIGVDASIDEDMEVLVVEDSSSCMVDRPGAATRLASADDADLVLEDMEEMLAGDPSGSHDNCATGRAPLQDPMIQPPLGRGDRLAAAAVFSPPPRSSAREFASEPATDVGEPLEEAPSMELWDSILTDIQDDVGSMGAVGSMAGEGVAGHAGGGRGDVYMAAGSSGSSSRESSPESDSGAVFPVANSTGSALPLP